MIASCGIRLASAGLALVALLASPSGAQTHRVAAARFGPSHIPVESDGRQHDTILVVAPKSAVLAGILSAYVPGAGSYYAGNNAHGTTHLLVQAVSGTATLIALGKIMDGPETRAADRLFVTGGVTMLVNWGWSVLTAVNDTRAYNRRVPQRSCPVPRSHPLASCDRWRASLALP